MPKARKSINKGLPERWRLKHGAYYYRVPEGMESAWDGKKEFLLGRSLPDAYREWLKRMGSVDEIRTIGRLLDRYAHQVIPLKPATSRRRETQMLETLRRSMGEQPLAGLKPQHIYQYYDARSRKKVVSGKISGGATTARHEIALLSHVYTKAVEWGLIDKHPFKNEVRIKMPKPRERLVTGEEIAICMAMEPTPQRFDSTREIQAYISLRLLTGLRGTDIFRLPDRPIKDGVMRVKISKTGKEIDITATPALQEAVDRAVAARPVHIAPFLFCNRFGKGYFDEELGAANGFHAKWRTFMQRAMKAGLKEPFSEKDLRAACATGMASPEAAQKLLAHSSIATTKRIYRRKPEVVNPAG